jgi:hypothetical protein
MTISEADARSIAGARVVEVFGAERRPEVELVTLAGGWRVRVSFPDDVAPPLGGIRLIIDEEGRAHEYPSSYSPRMAERAFGRERGDA